MNWTGGTLQRTKHANKGVVQKQKAYFARARTQLQQSPGTPAAPFRPEYLRDGDDYELGQLLPSFGTGSVRHTRHLAIKRREESRHSPTTQGSHHTPGRSNPQGESRHSSQSRRNKKSGNEKQKERKRERKNADADAETELLEAHKERLLRQQDWVGVTSSRPVDMQFLSIKEKSRIGKRRKLESKDKTRTCRHHSTVLHRRAGREELADHDETFMSGALPALTTVDNIRIRIGSDALTTVPLTQPNNDARSQTSSDSMLFDEEGEDAAQVPGSEAPRDFDSHLHAADPRLGVPLLVRSDRSYLPEQDLYARNNLAQWPDGHAADCIRHTAAGSSAPTQSSYKSEATGPSYRLMYHVGGAERPLELVFGKARPSITSPTASATHQVGELRRVHAGRTAEESETDHPSRNVGEPPQHWVRRHPNPASIDDKEPWKPYLDTSTSSSGHVRVDDGTGTSVPQPHVPARNTRADRTSRPQHIVQGDLTHVNLSKVSGALPAATQRSGRVPDARSIPRANVEKGSNNDEALWQSYVLGSDPQSAIETIHTHDETSEDSMSHATKGYASTRLPMSNAVTTVSSTPFPSTPFKLLSGQASRISDDVQYAPHSRSWSITSVAPYGVWGRVESPSEEDVQDEDQGEETSARSRFGEQSTHASLQNYAAHDDAMFSDTRTSRSDLDQRGRTWDDVSRCAQASESVVWQ